MSENPEALRLADILQAQAHRDYAPIDDFRYRAAGKLRRQHAEIERLKAALPYDWDQLEACRGSLREHMAEIKRLTADNERLREALALAERLAAGRLAMVEQLTDEVEALRRDAERWRHWRDNYGFAKVDHDAGRCFVTLVCDAPDPDQAIAKRFAGQDCDEWLGAFTDAAIEEDKR